MTRESFSERWQAFDTLGYPVIRGVLAFRNPLTNAPLPVYADHKLRTPMGPEVVADGEGFFPPVFLAPHTYAVELRNEFGQILWIHAQVTPFIPAPTDLP